VLVVFVERLPVHLALLYGNLTILEYGRACGSDSSARLLLITMSGSKESGESPVPKHVPTCPPSPQITHSVGIVCTIITFGISSKQYIHGY
jgi:hypothetical protein